MKSKSIEMKRNGRGKTMFQALMSGLKKMPDYELITVCILASILILAIALAVNNFPGYKSLVTEDGFVEWLTVFSLLGCALMCFIRAIQLKSKRKKMFIFSLLLLGIVFFFGMGEEMSWGQRVFNIESSDFFSVHNTQEEMNIHNLEVMGVRINKAIFSLFLGVMICFYTFIMPVLYHKFAKFQKLVDKHAIPIPRNYQIVLYTLLMIVVLLINAPEKWELLEMVGSVMFLLMVLNPENLEIYKD
jgi:lysylphosphatidylglycerol synthetase-like protein (DUF2156 family)